jgi:two-component system response regulator AlgR
MNAPLQILLVDDEALARSRLRTLLADAARADPALPPLVVEEAADSAQAWARLQSGAFELVLLDIHMPGPDGLALAARLQTLERRPALVFVTAHSLDALDYLTKPVRLARLQQALARLLRQRAPAPPSSAGTLLIQDRGRSARVPLAEVLYFKAELKYLTVRTVAHSYILDSALGDIEARHSAQFLRIHRNALVARHALRALEKHHDPEEGEGWAVRLQGIDEPLAVSRRQLAAVRAALREAADSV